MTDEVVDRRALEVSAADGGRPEPADHPEGRIDASGPRIAWVPTAVLALVFLAAVGVMLVPTLDAYRRTLPWNLGDPALNTWILAWGWHALTTDPTSFFQGNIFFPAPDAIAYSEVMLPLQVVFGPVYALTDNPVLAHNVTIASLLLVSLVATYHLAVRVLGARDVAVVVALGFTFSGYVFMHVGHIQLLTIGFLPVAYLALFRLFEHRRWWDGLLLGGATWLVVTGCLYYGVLWIVLLAVLVVVELVRVRRDGEWRALLVPLAVGGVSSAVLLAPVVLKFLSFQSSTEFTREIFPDAGLKLLDLATPALGTRLWAELFTWANENRTNLVEHGLFPGVVVLVLAVVGAVIAARSLRARPLARAQVELLHVLVGGAVALVIAIGPEVFGIPMPYRVLEAVAPGFDDTRAVARFFVPGLLAIAVLAGFGLRRLVAGSPPIPRLVAVGAVGLLVCADLAVRPVRAAVDETNRQVYEALREEPEGAVVELPLAGDGPGHPFVEGPRMLASIGDWRPRVNGFSGGFPPGYVERAAILNQFPAAPAVEDLADIGVRFVVLHVSDGSEEGTYTEEQAAAIIATLPAGATATRHGRDFLVDLGP